MQTEINTDFIKEWKPYAKCYTKVKNAIHRHFMNNTYQFQATHDPASKKPFKPFTFLKIEETLGLAYTSTSSYAALWVCNGGYLWADPDHYFIGFAINENGQVIAITQDENENELYIAL